MRSYISVESGIGALTRSCAAGRSAVKKFHTLADAVPAKSAKPASTIPAAPASEPTLPAALPGRRDRWPRWCGNRYAR